MGHQKVYVLCLKGGGQVDPTRPSYIYILSPNFSYRPLNLSFQPPKLLFTSSFPLLLFLPPKLLFPSLPTSQTSLHVLIWSTPKLLFPLLLFPLLLFLPPKLLFMFLYDRPLNFSSCSYMVLLFMFLYDRPLNFSSCSYMIDPQTSLPFTSLPTSQTSLPTSQTSLHVLIWSTPKLLFMFLYDIWSTPAPTKTVLFTSSHLALTFGSLHPSMLFVLCPIFFLQATNLTLKELEFSNGCT